MSATASTSTTPAPTRCAARGTGRHAALRIEADAQLGHGSEDVGEAVALLAQADGPDSAMDAGHRDTAVVDPQQHAAAGERVAPASSEPGGQRPAQEPAEVVASSGSGLTQDSAERRQQTATGSEGKADAETTRACMVADVSGAKPATEAVLTQTASGEHAARGRRLDGHQRQRDGLSR